MGGCHKLLKCIWNLSLCDPSWWNHLCPVIHWITAHLLAERIEKGTLFDGQWELSQISRESCWWDGAYTMFISCISLLRKHAYLTCTWHKKVTFHSFCAQFFPCHENEVNGKNNTQMCWFRIFISSKCLMIFFLNGSCWKYGIASVYLVYYPYWKISRNK